MSDEEAKRGELQHILADIDPEMAKIETMGQKMIQAARFTREIAAPTREIITNLPSDSLQSGQFDQPLASWRYLHGIASQFQNFQPTLALLTAATSGTSSATVSGVLSIVRGNFTPPQPVQAAVTRLFHVLDRSPLVEQVRLSMTRLGLDSRGGTQRTALQLLDDAHTALQRPVINDGDPTSVLILLRESINAAITELIRKCPVQEKVSSWRDKVLWLGQHCARPELPMEHFDRIATDDDTLRKKLSGFKQGSLPREQMNEFFYSGVTLLSALLNSIDEGKLRA